MDIKSIKEGWVNVQTFHITLLKTVTSHFFRIRKVVGFFWSATFVSFTSVSHGDSEGLYDWPQGTTWDQPLKSELSKIEMDTLW